MNITPYCNTKPDEPLLLATYASLYLCQNKLRKNKENYTPYYVHISGMLKKIREEEAIRLYNQEILKVDEYLYHNGRSEFIYDPEEMFNIKLKRGIMKELTAQLLVDNGGLCFEDYDVFKERLLYKVEDDLFVLYEEIDRNLDGRYGVTYDQY